MAGHMGAARVTTQNLEVVKTDSTRGLIMVKGAVPGSKGGWVTVKDAVKKPFPENAILPAALKSAAEERRKAAEEAAAQAAAEAEAEAKRCGRRAGRCRSRSPAERSRGRHRGSIRKKVTLVMKRTSSSWTAAPPGSVELDEALFGLEPRADILHRVVRWQPRRAPGRHRTR